MKIKEIEVYNFYEAWVFAHGLLFSKVVYKDPISGWPYNYKVKAHEEIRQEVLKHEQRRNSQDHI